MLTKNELVEVRDVLPADKNFIYATWLRSLYYGDTWFREIPKDIFMKNYHKVVEILLSGTKINVRVACLKEDKDVILGYSITDNDDKTLHWIFCKSAWRKIGIGRSLLPEGLERVTHLTKLGRILLPKLPSKPVFNPFM